MGISPDRTLWCAVLWQSLDDAVNQSVQSPFYDEAISFLTSLRPYWRDARAEVAAHLDLHPDELLAAGRRWIAAHPRQMPERTGPRKERERLTMASLPPCLAEILTLRHVVKPRPRAKVAA